MSEGLNSAEQFVFELCRSSFLRLWSSGNPRGKDSGKELCDVLVICHPDVIIFSVKDINLKQSGNREVESSRWLKRAVQASAHQIYGAERHIKTIPHLICSDGSRGLPIPHAAEIRIHRVAVGIGSRGQVPLPFGDFGKGFIHVFDELSVRALLTELDTVADFVGYLRAKEQYCNQVTGFLQVREEDLLALYLHAGRKFPDRAPDVLATSERLWETLSTKSEFVAKKKADEISYVWDNVIELFSRDVLTNNLEPSACPSNAERALRVMAREDRFSRRVLGEGFKQFFHQSKTQALARMLMSPSKVVYVFLAWPRDAPRNLRQMELSNRCFVARGHHPESTTAVGIGTEQYSKEGFSLDIAHVHIPEWTDVHQEAMRRMQEELGYFVNPRVTETTADEYPTD